MLIMADQFCLRWNNFQTNIVSALESLKLSEDLVDVTLTCEGRNIKAHKVILSACSPYFRTVFKENPCQHPVIILKDVQAEDIISLLSYMYQGEVFIEESKLSSFLHTAALLQVKGLTGVTQQNRESLTGTSSAAPITSNKLYTQLTISSKSSKPATLSLLKDPKSNPAPKKRRSSTSDKPNDVNLFDSHKKPKVSEENVNKVNVVRHENNVEPNNRTEQLAHANGSTSGTQSAQPPHPIQVTVTVKTEADDEDSQSQEMLSSAEKENENMPDYENSMLARSLISGINPSKSDINANNSSPKSKMPAKIDSPAGPRPRDTLSNTTAFPKKSPAKTSAGPDEQIKSERHSPKMEPDFEPEILISEHGEHSENYSQDQSQALLLLAGMGQGASTSQGLSHQSNHAAICGDCPHCGMKYSNQSALKYHVRLMHSDLTNRLCCYLCPSSFTMRETYKEHMFSTHGQRS